MFISLTSTFANSVYTSSTLNGCMRWGPHVPPTFEKVRSSNSHPSWLFTEALHNICFVNSLWILKRAPANLPNAHDNRAMDCVWWTSHDAFLTFCSDSYRPLLCAGLLAIFISCFIGVVLEISFPSAWHLVMNSGWMNINWNQRKHAKWAFTVQTVNCLRSVSIDWNYPSTSFA